MLRVRIGLHTGEARPARRRFFRPGRKPRRPADVFCPWRAGASFHSSRRPGHDRLPDGVGLRDLGEHRLKDLERPEHIFQLTCPDLPSSFPALATLDRRPNNLPRSRLP